jgi:hypothetical protein
LRLRLLHLLLEGGHVAVLRGDGHGEIADEAAEKGDLARHLGDRRGQARGHRRGRLGEARLNAQKARRQRIHFGRDLFGLAPHEHGSIECDGAQGDGGGRQEHGKRLGETARNQGRRGDARQRKRGKSPANPGDLADPPPVDLFFHSLPARPRDCAARITSANFVADADSVDKSSAARLC